MNKNTLFWTGIGASAAALVGLAMIVSLATTFRSIQIKKIDLAKKPIANTAVVQAKKGRFVAKVSNKYPQVGQDIVVTVVANSSRENILGYDIAMQYPGSVDYISSDTLLTDFDIYAADYPEEGKILLTGAKKLTSQDPTPFADTPIATLRFRASQRGPVDIIFLIKENDKTESNMFGMQNVDILGKAQDVHIEVQ